MLLNSLFKFTQTLTDRKVFCILFLLLTVFFTAAQNSPRFVIPLQSGTRIMKMAQTTDGRLAAIGDNKGNVSVYSAATGSEKYKEKFPSYIRFLELTADGSHLVIVSGKDSVFVRALNKGGSNYSFVLPFEYNFNETYPQFIRSISITKGKQLLIAASKGNYRCNLIAYTGVLPLFSDIKIDPALQIVSIPPGNEIAVISERQGFKIWGLSANLSNAEPRLRFAVEYSGYGEQYCMAISPSGRLLARAWRNGTIEYFDLQSGRSLKKMSFDTREKRYSSPVMTGVNSLHFSSDEKLILAAMDDKTVRVYSVEDGREINRYAGMTKSIAFFANKDDFIMVGADSEIRFYTNNYSSINKDEERIGVQAAKDSSRTSTLINIALSKSKTQVKLTVPYGHQNGVRSSSFSKNGKWMVTDDAENSIVWDVVSGKPLHYLTGNSPQFDKEGGVVVTKYNTDVFVWSLENGELIHTLHHQNKVNSLSFSSKGNKLLVVTGSTEAGADDHAVSPFIWNYYTGKKIIVPFVQAVAEKGSCSACYNNNCLLYGAAFDKSGDRLILAFSRGIKIIDAENYAAYTSVCFPWVYPDNPQVRFLDNDAIVYLFSSEDYLVSTTGEVLASLSFNTLLPYSKIDDMQIAISPAKNYAAVVEANAVKIIGLGKNSKKTFAADNIKSLHFNNDGSHLLLNRLDEGPELYELPGLKKILQAPEAAFAGLPRYLLITKLDSGYKNSKLTTGLSQKGKIDSLLTGISGKMPNTGNFSDGIIDMAKGFIDQTFSNLRSEIISSYGNEGEIISVSSGRTISEIKTSVIKPATVEVSPNGEYFYYRYGGKLYIYSLKNAKATGVFETTGAQTRFTPDGQHLLILYSNGGIKLVDISSGKIVKESEAGSPVSGSRLTFTPNGKAFYVSFTNYQLFSTENLSAVEKKPDVVNCSFSKDGKYKGFSYRNNVVRVFEISGKNSLIETAGSNICFGSKPGSFVVWDKKTITYFSSVNPSEKGSKIEDLAGLNYDHVLISEGDKYLYIQAEKTGRIYNLKSNSFIAQFTLNTNNSLPVTNMGSLVKGFEDANTPPIYKSLFQPLLADFSLTGDSLLVVDNKQCAVYSCKDGQPLNAYLLRGNRQYFSMTGNLIVTFDQGQVKFMRAASGNDWFSFIPFLSGKPVFVMPDGLYYGSNNQIRQLGYVSGAKSLSIKQFDRVNNRPDLVLKGLGCKDECLLSVLKASYQLRKNKGGVDPEFITAAKQLPVVSIIDEDKIPGQQQQNKLELRLKFQDSYSDLARFNISVNGNPVITDKNGLLPPSVRAYERSVTIDLSAGKNIIETSVINNDGLESIRIPLVVNYTPPVKKEKKLFFIGLGASKYGQDGGKDTYNLRWAAKDVLNMAAMLKNKFSGLVITHTLIDEAVTTENLSRLKENLKASEKDDIIIVYYAGHGILNTENGEVYFGTYDIDFVHPSAKGITLNHFRELLDGVSSYKKAVFLDACHSGELNRRVWDQTVTCATTKKINPVSVTSDKELESLYKKALQQTPEDDKKRSSDKTNSLALPAADEENDPFKLTLELYTDAGLADGSFIIAAAEGLQSAIEDEQFENGVFTHSLLGGVASGKADLNGDRLITIQEIKGFLINDVSQLSSGRQRPQARQENSDFDWILFGDEDKAKSRQSFLSPVTGITAAPQNTQQSLPKNYAAPQNTSSGNLQPPKNTIINKENKKNLSPATDTISIDIFKTDKTYSKLFADSNIIITCKVSDSTIKILLQTKGFIPNISFDNNRNNKIDPCIDRGYGLIMATMSICPYYMLTGGSSTPCGRNNLCPGQPSKAILKISGDVYWFSIPINELNPDMLVPELWFTVSLFKSSNGLLYYPITKNQNRFSEVFKIKL